MLSNAVARQVAIALVCLTIVSHGASHPEAASTASIDGKQTHRKREAYNPATMVYCPGAAQADYCDCGGDCEDHAPFCDCEAADTAQCCGPYNKSSSSAKAQVQASVPMMVHEKQTHRKREAYNPATMVYCPGAAKADYCDCGGDCEDHAPFCDCEAADTPQCCGPYNKSSSSAKAQVQASVPMMVHGKQTHRKREAYNPATMVYCPGAAKADYCDCGGDCEDHAPFCDCEAADTPQCCGPYNKTSYSAKAQVQASVPMMVLAALSGSISGVVLVVLLLNRRPQKGQPLLEE